MKRKIFFWLERLKITPDERKTLSGLAMLLVLLGSLNLTLSPAEPFEDDDYLELEKQFEKRKAILEAEENELMEQYYPDDTAEAKDEFIVAMDTLPDDSTAEEVTRKASQNTLKGRININTASVKDLETLPGIGPAYAQRIIEYRDENDGFETIEELKKIKGIAQKRLEKLKPFIKLKDSK